MAPRAMGYCARAWLYLSDSENALESLEQEWRVKITGVCMI